MKGLTFKKGRIGDSLFAHSFFKSFIVFVVMIIMTTSSASAEVIDGLNYKLYSDANFAILLPKTDGKYSGDIIVPEKFKDDDGVEYSVKYIEDDCFNGCSGLTSITIPSSVTYLPSRCFFGCSSLTSVTLPSSIEGLGKSCFYGCSSLTTITIPPSVTELNEYCFYGCSSLTSVTFSGSYYSSVGSFCFALCSSLTSITLPSSIRWLGDYCFYHCSSLTSITIPSSIEWLGESCFNGCSSLTSVTIPYGIRSIYRLCFYGCSNLESLYLDDNHWSDLDKDFSSIPTTCMIYVPTSTLHYIKNEIGPDYKYILAWESKEEGGDADKPDAQCATPSVFYESGELKFACKTSGAKYHYTVSDSDLATNALSEDGKVSLAAAYNISVYATADGYAASEKAEATLYWIKANLSTANINQAKARGIVASAHNGIVNISGLDNGEEVKFYAVDGKLVGSSSAVGGVASCSVSESMVIAKIGMETIKVLMK